MKKLSIFLLVLLSSLALVSCKKDPVPKPDPDPTPEETDTTAPAFLGLVGGRLETVQHLKGEEVDLLEGVRARDNVDKEEDLVIIIKDNGGYNKGVAGEYELTYEAKDKSDNASTVKRTVIVLETLDIVFDHALLIGDASIQAIYNDPNALKLTGDNAKFRLRSDVINVLDKAEFLRQTEEFYPGSHAAFAWGNLAIIDNTGKLVHMRFAQGAQFEIDAEGNIEDQQANLVWFTSTGAGDLLKGVDQAFLDELLPNGGKILLAPTKTGNYPDAARIFLIKNLFWSEYLGGGGVLKDVEDVPVSKRVVQLQEDFKVTIPMPERIATPVIEINRHVLSWDEIPNAKGYDFYVNGEKHNTEILSVTTVNLLDLVEDDEVGTTYQFEVVALSNDLFSHADSLVSNKLSYTKIEILRMATPVATQENGVISWGALEGAASYEVFVRRLQGGAGNGATIMIPTTELSYDLNDLAKDHFGGPVVVHIKGIGDDEYSDSDNSNNVNSRVAYETSVMKINGLETTVVEMTAENYFARRNGGLENYMHVIKGVKQYVDAGNSIIETWSAMAILDSSNKAKFVRSLVAKHTYTAADGWFIDEVYGTEGKLLDGIYEHLAEDDVILMGKNGVNTTFVDSEQNEHTMAAKFYLTYHFVKSWDGFANATKPNGPYADMSTFVDAKTIEVTFTK